MNLKLCAISVNQHTLLRLVCMKKLKWGKLNYIYRGKFFKLPMTIDIYIGKYIFCWSLRLVVFNTIRICEEFLRARLKAGSVHMRFCLAWC